MRMRSWSRHLASKHVAALLVVTALLALAAVPVATRGACPADAAASLPPAAPVEAASLEVARTSGIDLQVRLLNLRIEFPWMKALPVSPGHRIVVSMLASDR